MILTFLLLPHFPRLNDYFELSEAVIKLGTWIPVLQIQLGLKGKKGGEGVEEVQKTTLPIPNTHWHPGFAAPLLLCF